MTPISHRPQHEREGKCVAFEEPIQIRQFPTRRALHLACKSCSLPRSHPSIHPFAKYTLEPLLRLGAGCWGIHSLPPTSQSHSIKQRNIPQNAAVRVCAQLHFLPIFAKRAPLVTVECDINIALNGCSGFATSTQKGSFTAKLMSRSRAKRLYYRELIREI